MLVEAGEIDPNTIEAPPAEENGVLEGGILDGAHGPDDSLLEGAENGSWMGFTYWMKLGSSVSSSEPKSGGFKLDA